MPVKQAQVIYKGRVQGVGFRFTVQGFALDFGVSGWAKNLDNGDVEVVAQAEESVLNDFLEKIRDVFFDYIKDEQVDWPQPVGNFNNFQIRF